MFHKRLSKKITHLKTLLGVGALLMLPSATADASCGPSDTVYIGSVCTTAISFCPRGYTPMAGQLLAVSEFNALYSLLGCSWGGNCRTSFALPDMRGRSPIGTGQGPGLTDIKLGEKRGAETHTLTKSQLAEHNHDAIFTPTGVNDDAVSVTLEAYTSGAYSDNPATANYISGGGSALIFGAGGLGAQLVELSGVTVTGGGTGGGTVNIADAGQGRPFSIAGPVTALTHCIATEGLYPPRS